MAKRRSQSEVQGWLLFFYGVPSTPVSNRMKVWRKLTKAGAVQLKGSVYILPDNDEHYEFLQWLVSEVQGMRGDASFVRIKNIETIKDEEIIHLFNNQRNHDYEPIKKSLNDIERRFDSIRKGAKARNTADLAEQLNKITKAYEEIGRIDFFGSTDGARLGERIASLKKQLSTAGAETIKERSVSIRDPQNYQSRIWVTRSRPFVDRMASAWLIKRFIDCKASFGFIDEKDIHKLSKNQVTFDIREGEFTHAGDMCTFEVLIKAFALKDRVLRKMAEIVHDLDMKDGKYDSKEAKGIEEILAGIRKTAINDEEALQKGMSVFEMIYISRS